MIFDIPLSYKFVVTMAMIVHANYLCEELNIPLDHSITYEDIKENVFVTPPALNEIGGSFTFEYKQDREYFFGYSDGYLARFWINDFMSGIGMEKLEENVKKISQKKTLIDGQQAYQLATNWLSLSGVDIKKLQSGYTYNIVQKVYGIHDESDESRLLSVQTPIYSIEWFGDKPKIKNFPNKVCSMNIDGSTKSLIMMEINDVNLFLIQPIKIHNESKESADYEKLLEDDEIIQKIIFEKKKLEKSDETQLNESQKNERQQVEKFLEQLLQERKKLIKSLSEIKPLLTIPDEEFLKMDETQKSNLVKRFVAPESMQRISSTKKDTPAKEQKTEEKKKTD